MQNQSRGYASPDSGADASVPLRFMRRFDANAIFLPADPEIFDGPEFDKKAENSCVFLRSKIQFVPTFQGLRRLSLAEITPH
jgi:hypothetical protein